MPELGLTEAAVLVAVAAGIWRDTVYADRVGGAAGVWPEEQALANLVDAQRGLEAEADGAEARRPD